MQLRSNVLLAASEQKRAEALLLADVRVEVVCDFVLVLFPEAQKIRLELIPDDHDLLNVAAYVWAIIGPWHYTDGLVSTMLLAFDVSPLLLDG